jgi:hypothetical protein
MREWLNWPLIFIHFLLSSGLSLTSSSLIFTFLRVKCHTPDQNPGSIRQANCKKFTDPYIEQSSIILILDLFLLKPQVYYHLLFNSKHSFQSFHSQLPAPHPSTATSSHDGTNQPRSKEVNHQNLKAFKRVHLELSGLIYCLILILESSWVTHITFPFLACFVLLTDPISCFFLLFN